MYGKHHNEETKKKILNNRMGKMCGENHHFYNKKLPFDVWNKGKKNCYNDKTLEKMKLAKLSKPQSQESIEKRKLSFIPKNRIKVLYKYLIFDSITEASFITNIPITNIRRWCKSTDYKDWNFYTNL